MREPQHHPSNATLAAYAAGALPVPHAMLVARHMKYCPACRATRAGFEAVAASLVCRLESVPLRDGMLDDVMERLDQPIIEGFQSRRAVDANMDYRDTVVRTILPGVRLSCIIRTRTHPSTALYYLEMEPGISFPMHTHGGPEMLLVFEGGLIDSDGSEYGPGDLADVDDATTHHAPKAMPGGVLRGWIAATGRYSFDNLIPRIVQPFVGL